MTRSLGVLYAIGSLVGLAFVALSPGVPGAVVATTVALAILLSGVTLAVGPAGRLPTWSLHVLFGVVQVALAVFFVVGQDPTSDSRMAFLWAGALAGAFLRPRLVAAHVVFSQLVVTVSLLLIPGALLVEVRSGMTIGAVMLLVAGVVSTVSGGLHRAQGRLIDSVERDELTGAPNRRGLRRALEDALAGGEEEVELALLDLEGFTHVNESYGFRTGDELLVHVTGLLTGLVGEAGLVARSGGDEVAVLLRRRTGGAAAEDPGWEEAAVDALLRCALQAVGEPAVLSSATVRTSANAGVAGCRVSGRSVTALLRDADLALHRAKETGGGTLVRFDQALRAEGEQRLRMAQLLEESLDASSLSTVHQPVVDIHRDEIVGTEVLVRWYCHELGHVPPAVFVPLAEQRGLVVRLGSWVLRQSVAQLAEWRAAGLVAEGFRVAVNVSARQLQEGFDAEVLDLLAEHGVPGEALVLEITETTLLQRPDLAARVLRPLREVGVHVALDDFGTGYSALSYLLGLSADVLKVDRSFVAGLGADATDDPAGAAATVVVAAVVEMARGLKLGVVAEGVETTGQLEHLRGLGVRQVQGYLLARPGPAAETTRWLEGARAGRPGPVAAATGRQPPRRPEATSVRQTSSPRDEVPAPAVRAQRGRHPVQFPS